MDTYKFSEIGKFKAILLELSRKCMLNCKNAVSYCSTGNVNLIIPINYINLAYTSIQSAIIIYIQTCESGEIQIFEDFKEEFDEFSTKLLDSFETNNSTQWSIIKCNRLEELYKNLVLHLIN